MKMKKKVLQINYQRKIRKRLKKLSKKPLNGLMITKKLKKKNLKLNKKNWNKLQTQSSKKFTKQVLVVPVVNQKMTKIRTSGRILTIRLVAPPPLGAALANTGEMDMLRTCLKNRNMGRL